MDSTRLIIKDRGKTTHLLYTSAATGYPIVVETFERKEYLLNMADNLGVYIPIPITLSAWKNESCARHIENILLDDAEDVIGKALNQFFGSNVVTATISDRLKEEYQQKRRR